MNRLTQTIIALVVSISTFAQTTWKVDPAHSKVGFSVTHLVISEVEGKFNKFEGSIVASKEDFSGSKISFTVDAASIDTDVDQRDQHLRSEDFFFVEQHPELTFTSTSFKKVGKDQYELKGKLTMRGVTKTVTFDVEYGGKVVDGYGNTRVGFTATTSLNRMDYGIAWNAKTEHGTWTVGEDIDVSLKLEFIKK